MQTAYNKRYGEKNVLNGLCYFCKAKKLGNAKTCEIHYFKNLSRNILGDRNRYTELIELFYKQNRKCYITGLDLELGVNTSIDHIKPRCTHPELLNDISNMAFCDFRINKMKNGNSLEEFKQLCSLVIN